MLAMFALSLQPSIYKVTGDSDSLQSIESSKSYFLVLSCSQSSRVPVSSIILLSEEVISQSASSISVVSVPLASFSTANAPFR